MKELTVHELFDAAVARKTKGMFVRRPGYNYETCAAFRNKVKKVTNVTVTGQYLNGDSRYSELHLTCVIDGVEVKMYKQQGWGDSWLYVVVANKKQYDKMIARISV